MMVHCFACHRPFDTREQDHAEYGVYYSVCESCVDRRLEAEKKAFKADPMMQFAKGYFS